MAIAFDNAATPVQSATPATTLETAAFTIAGSDRILLVLVESDDGTPVDPSAVKWGGSSGTSLTKVGTTIDVGSFMKMSLWRLIAPATGSNTVHVTWGSSQSGRGIIAASYTGVDQTTPLGTSASASGSSTAITVNVSSAADQLVIDLAGAFSDGDGRTLTVGASQTSRGEIEGIPYISFGMSEEVGAGTTTMSWSLNSDASWATRGIPLLPSSGGGGGGIVRQMLMQH